MYSVLHFRVASLTAGGDGLRWSLVRWWGTGRLSEDCLGFFRRKYVSHCLLSQFSDLHRVHVSEGFHLSAQDHYKHP